MDEVLRLMEIRGLINEKIKNCTSWYSDAWINLSRCVLSCERPAKSGESKSKSDMTSMVSLFAVIGFIVVVAYSMEIKTFLTQL